MTTENRVLVMEHGADWEESVLWEDEDGVPISTAGFSAKMAIARRPGDTPLKTLSSETGEIVLGESTGVIRMVLDATATDILPSSDFNNPFVFDLFVDDGEVREQLLKGKVVNRARVTPR
jgi:hypothetical protein